MSIELLQFNECIWVFYMNKQGLNNNDKELFITSITSTLLDIDDNRWDNTCSYSYEHTDTNTPNQS